MTSNVKTSLTISSAVIVADWNGTVMNADEEALRLFDTSLTAIINTSLCSILPLDEADLLRQLHSGRKNSLKKKITLGRQQFLVKFMASAYQQHIICTITADSTPPDLFPLLRLLENVLPDIYFISYRKNRISQASENLKKLLQYQEQEDFIYELQKYASIVDQLKDYKDLRLLKLTDSEGFKKVFSLNAVKVSPEETILVLKDTSAAAVNHQAITTKLQTLLRDQDRYLSEISHEFRTPMNAIIGIIHLLQKTRLDKEQQQAVNNLSFASRQLLNMINSILDQKKIEAGELEFATNEVNLRELLENVRSNYIPLAKEKGLKFEIQVLSVPEIVILDEVRLYQIISNLLGNAIKFTHTGGISISCTCAQGLLEIRVSDTGIGIDEQFHAEIFSPFKQGDQSISHRYGGTGLGLSIIRKLIELQKGEIELSSSPGKGSIFTVKLPFKRYNSPGTDPDLFPESYQLLYVEDVESNQYLMKSLVESWGGKLLTASTAARGMELLAWHSFHLLLVDMHLPDQTGLDFIRMVREKNPGLPILPVSGDFDLRMKKEIRNLGIRSFITKPFDPRELRKQISDNIQNLNRPVYSGHSSLELDFSLLEKLYQNKPEELKNLLGLMIEEYKKYFEALSYVIRQGDLKGLRSIHHKLKANLKSFQISDLDDLLERTKFEMRNQHKTMGKEKLILALKEVFDQIINNLHYKNSLIELNK